MAKKFVRGITDIKTINNQDFDTNNVNDLLSDGKHNYIHRKKGNSEEYHNLTNNLKTVTSDDTDLLEVTNDNDTSNSATLHPKHDSQKEQAIESTRNTVTIEHGENGTSETTKVDTNPEKVLEHDKLKTGDGLATLFDTDETTIIFKPTQKPANTNLNTLDNGFIWGVGFNENQLPNRDTLNPASFTTIQTDSNKKVQLYIRESTLTAGTIVIFYRFILNGTPTGWRQMAVDNEQLLSLLAQKQNTITNNLSIGVTGSGLRQLYTQKQTYNVNGGLLKTHVKSISQTSSINTPEEEFNFIAKIDKGVPSVSFTLNDHDKTKFTNIMNTYGQNNTVRISGFVFTLAGSTLTVSASNNTNQNYVITFSDII